ncbi:cysteine hydrolase family protein [Flavitalea flava]
MKQELLNGSALILIDIQKGFDQLEPFGGERNNPQAEHNASLLLHYWRKNNWPLFHVKHCSLKPNSPLAEGQPGNEIKDEVKPLPGETLIRKNVNSAFIGTDLKTQLDAQGIRTVVIAGLTTQHCISTTARMAGNYGYNTFVLSDATAAFNSRGLNGVNYPAELVHQLSLATINREFATVLPTGELLEILASINQSVPA